MRTLTRLASSKTLRYALPLLAAALFCRYTVWEPFAAGQAVINYTRLNYGSSLLAGLLNNNVTWMMPLFETAFSFALNFAFGPLPLLLLTRLACYLLVFCAGCRLRGYWAGLAALAGAGLFEIAGPLRFDDEQAFYALFLLLVLNVLLLKRRPGLRNALLAGLAVGFSLLVRTPLLLFPPLAALLDLALSRGDRRAALRRGAVMLAACYALLLPWGLLNRSVSGSFTLVDGRRAACNLVTGALGSVYTMEGDWRALAGLDENASPAAFYLREAARAPGTFLLNYGRRLWRTFLFYPALFALFLLAAARARGRIGLLPLALPFYFVLVHAAMSVEDRYFYPLLFLLPPFIAAGLAPGRPEPGAEPCPAADRAVLAVFWTAFAAVLAVEALVAAYPLRAARNLGDAGYLAELSVRFPRDRVFQELRCRLLLAKGEDAAYPACLADYGRRFGDEVVEYFLKTGASQHPAEVPLPRGRMMECSIVRMLRELELGDTAAAGRSFAEAFSYYGAYHGMLRGEPYRRDRELALRIRAESGAFWNEYVYAQLALFEPRRLAVILPRLARLPELPAGSRPYMMAELLSLGPGGELMLRKRLAADAAGIPAGRQCRLWKEEAAGAKRLSDRAVDAITAGDLKGAEKLLSEALRLDPASPEAYMNLCAVEQRRGNRTAALKACRAAAYAVYFNPENGLPQMRALAADAARTGAGLLREAGREDEARRLLSLAGSNAKLEP